MRARSNAPDEGADSQMRPDFGDGESPAMFHSRSLRDYFVWYLRYSWLLVLTTVTGLLIGYYVYNMTPPVYQSWAVIELERVREEAIDLQEDQKLRLSGASVIASAVEKLQMPSLFEAIANSELFLNRKGVVPEQRRWRFPWNKGEREQAERARQSVSPGSLAGMMRGWIDVKWRNQTNLIDLYAKHTDPEIARDVLRGVLKEYVQHSKNSVVGPEDDAFEYIMQSIKEVQNSILRIEQSVNRYNGCLQFSRQIDAASTEVVELEKRYLPKWPPLVEAKEKVRILKELFAGELQLVLTSFHDEQEFWQENLKSVSADQKNIVDVQPKASGA